MRIYDSLDLIYLHSTSSRYMRCMSLLYWSQQLTGRKIHLTHMNIDYWTDYKQAKIENHSEVNVKFIFFDPVYTRSACLFTVVNFGITPFYGANPLTVLMVDLQLQDHPSKYHSRHRLSGSKETYYFALNMVLDLLYLRFSFWAAMVVQIKEYTERASWKVPRIAKTADMVIHSRLVI